MISQTIGGKVFSVETDWEHLVDNIDFSSTTPQDIKGKYYIDKVEVSKEFFEAEYRKAEG